MSVLTLKRLHTQRGVSIVEALVALLVLSIGMLGIAVMYLESVRANRTALSRTLAIQLVNDMADRIRANRGARGAYTLALGAAPSTAPTDCAAIGKTCTPGDLALYDIKEWSNAVKDTLPKGGDGKSPAKMSITYKPGTTTNDPGTYAIVSQWTDAGSEDPLETRLEFTQIGTT